MAAVIDVYRSVESYTSALKSLENDQRLPPKNRALAAKWLRQKEHDLLEGFSREEQKDRRIRTCKTLNKYVTMLTNVCYWFPDLTDISEAKLKKFKEDFFADRIRSIKGKVLLEKRDYLNKVIKSDFFRRFLGHDAIVEKVFSARVQKRKVPVEFITEDDLDAMLKATHLPHIRAAIATLFYSGLRVGELLNLKCGDVETKFNTDTKTTYFLLHVRAEYSKSDADRTVPIFSQRCIDLLKAHMRPLADKESLFAISYEGLRKAAQESASRAKIKTRPLGQSFHIHLLRKSATTYWINLKFGSDDIKAMLGHKPSSQAIDAYLNYAGKIIEPAVSAVQHVAYEEVQRDLEFTRSALNSLQAQTSKANDENKLLRERMAEQEREMERLQKAVLFIQKAKAEKPRR